MTCEYGDSLHNYTAVTKTFPVHSGDERFPLNADADAIGLIDLGRALAAK
jgi:hypothetical protein